MGATFGRMSGYLKGLSGMCGRGGMDLIPEWGKHSKRCFWARRSVLSVCNLASAPNLVADDCCNRRFVRGFQGALNCVVSPG